MSTPDFEGKSEELSELYDVQNNIHSCKNGNIGTSLEFISPIDTDGTKKVVIEEEEVREELERWNNALIGFVLGTNPSFQDMQTFVESQWSKLGQVKLFLLDYGVFIFDFNDSETKQEVLELGPWAFGNNNSSNNNNDTLILKPWSAEANLEMEGVDAVPIWIRLSNLKLHLWSPRLLSKISSLVGVPLFTDRLTARRERLSYARVCVEVKVGVELPHLIEIQDSRGGIFKQKVEYEWRPSVCIHCGMFRHKEVICPKLPKAEKVWVVGERRDEVGQTVVTQEPVTHAESSATKVSIESTSTELRNAETNAKEQIGLKKKQQEEEEDKRRYKAQAHLYTIIKVAQNKDLVEQIGRDIYFDLVDHDKVCSFCIQKLMPFNLFKGEVAKAFGIPVQFQRFWIWVKRQNNTYRPYRPLTPQEEAQSVGQLSEVSSKKHNAELKLFLEVELGLDLCPVPLPGITEKKILVFFKLYDPKKEELRYVGRLFVRTNAKPMKILKKLNEMAGFAPNENIELYEEIKFEPCVFCVHLDKRTSFQFSEIQDGDIICFQKFRPESEEHYRYPDVPSFLEYVHNRKVQSA